MMIFQQQPIAHFRILRSKAIMKKKRRSNKSFGNGLKTTEGMLSCFVVEQLSKAAHEILSWTIIW